MIPITCYAIILKASTRWSGSLDRDSHSLRVDSSVRRATRQVVHEARRFPLGLPEIPAVVEFLVGPQTAESEGTAPNREPTLFLGSRSSTARLFLECGGA